MKNYNYYLLKGIGRIGLGEEDGCITDLHFENGRTPAGEITVSETPLLKEAYTQLCQYVSGDRRKFNLLHRAGLIFSSVAGRHCALFHMERPEVIKKLPPRQAVPKGAAQLAWQTTEIQSR